MTLIDKSGERQACDRCHRVRVKIRRGAICVDCRHHDARLAEDARLVYRTARARKYAERPYADAV